MSRRTRVFIVDDSAVSRLALRSMLESDPLVRVIGEANDGKTAVAQIPHARPDLVLMDVMMPAVDGLEATRRLMSSHPLPIVMISDLVGRQANLNFEALEAGALDLLRKPAYDEVLDPRARACLARKIRVLAGVPVVMRRRNVGKQAPAPAAASPSAGTVFRNTAIRRVCIGGSTGGPVALARLLEDLGPSPPWPVVVVQHMACGFVHAMARWLKATGPCEVEVVKRRLRPRPGTVYLAPDGQHLKFSGRELVTSPEPSDRLHRPAIDVLFESLAEACLGRESLGVLLTGMGEDGARGLAAVRRSGGWTIVQDEATSVVWGMAAAARRVGAACETLPIHRIGKRLLSLTDSESKRSC